MKKITILLTIFCALFLNANLEWKDFNETFNSKIKLPNELKKQLSYLNEKNIGTLIQWGGKGIHQLTQLGFDQVLPDTDKFFKRCIMLPMNIFISDSDVDYVCESVVDFYKK